jgi:acyl carrier protein
MTTQDIEKLIVEAIQSVAPEIDKNDIKGDEDIRDECDLDSMDFINYLEALQESTGIAIREDDYPNLTTFNNATTFLLIKSKVMQR